MCGVGEDEERERSGCIILHNTRSPPCGGGGGGVAYFVFSMEVWREEVEKSDGLTLGGKTRYTQGERNKEKKNQDE